MGAVYLHLMTPGVYNPFCRDVDSVCERDSERICSAGLMMSSKDKHIEWIGGGGGGGGSSVS